MTKPEWKKAFTEAFAAPFTPRERTSGCGRAYVCLTGIKKERRAVAAAAKEAGVMYLKDAYGTGGDALYIGYDNCDGRALGKADAVEASLKAAGIGCYVDAVGD